MDFDLGSIGTTNEKQINKKKYTCTISWRPFNWISIGYRRRSKSIGPEKFNGQL